MKKDTTDTQAEKTSKSAEPEKSTFEQFKYKRHHHGSAFWAIILISFGLIFLLNNFGLLPWSVWGNLWRLWPLLLIIWGLQVIFGRSYLANLIIGIIGLVIVVTILGLSLASVDKNFANWANNNIPLWQQTNSYFMHGTEQLTKESKIAAGDYQGIESRSLTIKIGAAKFSLTDSDSTDYLVVDSKYFSGQGEPTLTSSKKDSNLSADFDAKDNGGFYFMMGTPSYDFVLGQSQIPVALDLNLGAGSANIDLSRQKISQIKLEQGAGESTIQLGQNSIPTEKSSINLGAGSVNLEVPKEVGLKINYKVGLGQLSVAGNNLRGDGTYTSQNYDTAATKMEIDIEIGAGSIKINN